MSKPPDRPDSVRRLYVTSEMDTNLRINLLFTHFYLAQVQKLGTWFVSPASRDYFGTEITTFLSTN